MNDAMKYLTSHSIN